MQIHFNMTLEKAEGRSIAYLHQEKAKTFIKIPKCLISLYPLMRDITASQLTRELWEIRAFGVCIFQGIEL